MILLIGYLILQNLFLLAVLCVLGYRTITGRWPRWRSPSVPAAPGVAAPTGPALVPSPTVPPEEIAVPEILQRFAAKPPTADYAGWPKERRERFAKEIYQKGVQNLAR